MDGIKRVVISNVSPAVDCGQFPVKAIIEEPLTIAADIFADGHDTLAAAILIKHSTEKQWTEQALTAHHNDHWFTSFTPSKTGVYQFRVIAWINKFGSWQKDFAKKTKGNYDLETELNGGIAILSDLLKTATGKTKNLIQNIIHNIGNEKDITGKIAIALDDKINDLLCKCRDKNAVTTHPQIFEITADRKKAAYSTWYELFPRSASAEPGKHGTFADVINLLPRISKMGFDVLYLPPVHPIGITHRKGRNNALSAIAGDPGSPWAIGNSSGGHKAIHPDLGTIKDFRNLIKESKKHNVEIAMDIAFQCSPDHPYLKEHPEWFKWRPDGTVQYAENPPKKYEDIVPFDFECTEWQALWQELKSIIEYWISNGVNIFRVDNPHTKAIPFWKWVIREIKMIHPDIIFLAEAFTRPRIMEHLAKIGFTQSYTYFTWRNTRHDLQEYVAELTQTNLKYYFQPNFWPNTPDILTDELVHGGENMHIIRLILAATLSSSYGIYGPVYEYTFNEPMPGKEEYNDNEKYEIKNWDWNRYTKTKEIITRINRIRATHSALQTTANVTFANTDNEKIMCYIKQDKNTGDTLIIVVNIDPCHTQKTNISFSPKDIGKDDQESYMVHDLLSGDRYTWQGGASFAELNPYDIPAHILHVKHTQHAR